MWPGYTKKGGGGGEGGGGGKANPIAYFGIDNSNTCFTIAASYNIHVL